MRWPAQLLLLAHLKVPLAVQAYPVGHTLKATTPLLSAVPQYPGDATTEPLLQRPPLGQSKQG